MHEGCQTGTTVFPVDSAGTWGIGRNQVWRQEWGTRKKERAVTDEPTLDTLAEPLDLLERENRWWKRVGALVLGAQATLILRGHVGRDCFTPTYREAIPWCFLGRTPRRRPWNCWDESGSPRKAIPWRMDPDFPPDGSTQRTSPSTPNHAFPSNLSST